MRLQPLHVAVAGILLLCLANFASLPSNWSSKELEMQLEDLHARIKALETSIQEGNYSNSLQNENHDPHIIIPSLQNDQQVLQSDKIAPTLNQTLAAGQATHLASASPPSQPVIIKTDWFTPPKENCAGKPCFNLGDEIGAKMIHLLAPNGTQVVKAKIAPDTLVVGSIINYWISNYNKAKRRSGLGDAYNITFWGSGTKYGVPGVCYDYRAVRGPKTHDVIVEKGCPAPEVYGDPALLLPAFFQIDPKPKSEPTTGENYCYIPHFSDYGSSPGVRAFLKYAGIPVEGDSPIAPFGSVTVPGSNITLLDIRTNETREFLTQLNQCDRVVSASLHGIIFSEAYDIPWAWTQLALEKGKRMENRFKYEDFFLSIGEEKSFPRSAISDLDPEAIATQILHNSKFSIRSDRKTAPLVDMCSLLRACPFAEPAKVDRILETLETTAPSLRYFRHKDCQ